MRIKVGKIVSPYNIMDNSFFIAIFTTVVFCISKFVEMKYLDQEWKPLKTLIRDAGMVFVSSLTASYVYFNFNHVIHDFFNVVTDTTTLNTATTQVFTDIPSF
jgi:hypothetical protein